MLNVMLGVAVGMSFIAGVLCVALVISKRKYRRLKGRIDVLAKDLDRLAWELEKQRNHKEVVMEVAE